MSARIEHPRLFVSFLDRVMILRRDTPAFTFGCSPECALHIDDPALSRRAGSIVWSEAVWMIYNDSRTRPFDVVIDGTPNPIHPRTSGDVQSIWALGPRPATIQLAAGRGRCHEIELEPELPVPPPRSPHGHGSTTPSAPVVRPPTQHERLLLAARFLSLPQPGEALHSNDEAARFANATLPPTGRTVTKAAVAMVVWRWRGILHDIGVQNVRDDSSLGRQLLAWGVIRQEDRRLLLSWRG